ncbi:MAG TPA: FecR domain-containing protein [Flavitalea sp.]|nr:FecR domain-containing protein [Flavitalea sp.]
MSTDQSYYRGFTAEQYAADEFFQSWVLRSDAGADAFWQTYLNLNPAEQEQVQLGRSLVLQAKKSISSQEGLTAEEKADIRAKIFGKLELEEGGNVHTINRGRPMLLAAASVLVLVAVSAFLLLKSPSISAPTIKMLVQTTGADETRKIFLPDSSIVILNAGSSLRYQQDFNSPQQREVFLDGNAFFIVRKQQDKKKFVVHSNSIAVTVLGTEFNVNTRNAATEVGLISGKVKVDARTTNRSEYMVPGEQVRFDSASNKLIKSSIDVNLYSAWLNNIWSFKQTNMSQVIELIEKYYGVKAEFKDPSIRNKKITASIPVENLDMIALILSKTVHTRIKHLNDRLIIQ